MQPLAIHGTEPVLVGKKLDALLCEAFVCRGAPHASANVVFLSVEGTWWRLALDAGTIHWRTQEAMPEPWSVPESGWIYPHTNVGNDAGLLGHRVEYVRSSTEGATARVEFGFSHGKRFIVSNMSDSTSYFVA
jgi:hypothetical protein